MVGGWERVGEERDGGYRGRKSQELAVVDNNIVKDALLWPKVE